MPELQSQPTRQVRLPEDLADMVTGIIEVEGGSVSELLDPMLRGPLTERFATIKDALETIRAARQSAQIRRAGAGA